MSTARIPGNYLAGANIAGFVKVADAMLDQGLERAPQGVAICSEGEDDRGRNEPAPRRCQADHG